MSRPNAHDIQVLNGLAGATLDSADGYHEAARETENPGYRDLFERRSFERRQVAGDLQAAVQGLGGEVRQDGSILAKASRAFHDIRHALLGDELSVVGPVEHAEDGLKTRFEKALEDSQISATTRETIRRAYAAVRTDHDQMRDLKHSLEGQRDASNRLYPQ